MLPLSKKEVTMNRIKLSEIKNNDPSEKEYFAHWGDNMGNKTLD